MKTIGIREAKTTFSALIDTVEAGEPVTITRHGKAAAVVVPVDAAARIYPPHMGFGAFLMTFPGMHEA